MADTGKRRPKIEAAPKRGEAAWRAARDAIASRNDEASRVAQEKRRRRDDEHAAELRAADRREREGLSKRQA
jgi:hypothetical protein